MVIYLNAYAERRITVNSKVNIDYKWSDKKRYFGAPISFTTYSLSDDRIFIKTGMLNERQEEILLYRIKDITMERSLFQRIFGVGSIILNTNDSSTPTVILHNITNTEVVKEMIHQNVEKAKKQRGMAVTEIYQ